MQHQRTGSPSNRSAPLHPASRTTTQWAPVRHRKKGPTPGPRSPFFWGFWGSGRKSPHETTNCASCGWRELGLEASNGQTLRSTFEGTLQTANSVRCSLPTYDSSPGAVHRLAEDSVAMMKSTVARGSSETITELLLSYLKQGQHCNVRMGSDSSRSGLPMFQNAQ